MCVCACVVVRAWLCACVAVIRESVITLDTCKKTGENLADSVGSPT